MTNRVTFTPWNVMWCDVMCHGRMTSCECLRKLLRNSVELTCEFHINLLNFIILRTLNLNSLINNGGTLQTSATTENDNSDKLRAVMDTNVMGLIFCTREMGKSIRKRDVDGHIIHINSIVGHFLPIHKEFDSYGIYSASKFAVPGLSEQHRQEFIKEKLNSKVTVSARWWFECLWLNNIIKLFLITD